MHWLQRTESLIGLERLNQLKKAHVLVVGLGGVGAYAAELIGRAGIGKMTLVDGDILEETNRNRQLLALKSNEGMPKTTVLAQRLKDINPEIELRVYQEFLRDKRIIKLLDSQHFDYVVDAIDSLSSKVFLLFHSVQREYRIISSMGSGGKTDPSKVRIADLSETYNCRLARMIRKRLARMGITKGIATVFSSEEVSGDVILTEEGPRQRSLVGTLSYMPPLFGCYMAGKVIRELASWP
jgi:tRNA threonylcarbamoyladenosine dehydratase